MKGLKCKLSVKTIKDCDISAYMGAACANRKQASVLFQQYKLP